MKIQRLLCKGCGHTFSYLPLFLIRYKQFLQTGLHRPLNRLMCGYRLNKAMEWECPGMSGITFRRYLAWYE